MWTTRGDLHTIFRSLPTSSYVYTCTLRTIQIRGRPLGGIQFIKPAKKGTKHFILTPKTASKSNDPVRRFLTFWFTILSFSWNRFEPGIKKRKKWRKNRKNVWWYLTTTLVYYNLLRWTFRHYFSLAISENCFYAIIYQTQYHE